jgi:SAM-dependent methyltransferase
VSSYDAFAAIYDDWASHMTEDVAFYVELAEEAEGPVVELAVGNGRVAIPVAQAVGLVLGIDSSQAMLKQARDRAAEAGVPLEVREGDMRELKLEEPAALIYCPFRGLLHLPTWADRRQVFERVAASLKPGGRFAWNAFAFNPHIAAANDGVWAEQAGIRHRVDHVPAEARIDITLESGDSGGAQAGVSLYDSIAELYDPWSRSVTEDVGFYVDEARRVGGPVVELAVGTGRIAVPTAVEGIRVIGLDSSPGMLEVCRQRAELAGVSELLDLRLGELEAPQVEERVGLVTCPFRSFLHLLDDGARLRALGAARELLLPGGRLVFDVFAPGAEDIADTHGRWLEREPGIFERAEWDSRARTLTLSVRGDSGATTFTLAWLSPEEWRGLLERAGFQVLGCFGWFDRRPYAGGEDTVWIARRPP